MLICKPILWLQLWKEKFQEFYANKEIPPVAAAAGAAEGESAAPVQDAEARPTKTEGEQTQIVVVGTAQFLTQLRPDGVNFFLNTVDWLTLGDALIGIRSHAITDRPLREVSEIEKNFIRYLCTIGIPLLVVIFGLLRYYLKQRAKRLVETYSTV